MIRRPLLLVFFLLLTLLFWSCSPKSLPETKPAYAADGKYDSGSPTRGSSAQLDKIAQSIYRVNVIAFYKTYTFDKSAQVTSESLKKGDAEKHALSHVVSSQSVLGTASVVYADNEKAALLTCAHVVNFHDTIIRYFPDSSGIIRSVALKLKQKNYVAGLNNPNVRLIATDDRHDIALLAAEINPDEHVDVMPFSIGKSFHLDWGTFVYIMGFPKGYKMVESGIVSKPDKNRNGFFLTNAIFNHGISGGPVFAIRDGSSHFEWVGIASSSSFTSIFYLEPKIEKAETYSKTETYMGKVSINNKKMINYGVTFSVSMDEIVRFIKLIEPKLEQQGFSSRQFFYH